MEADYHKLNQVLIVILAALSDVVSLLNQINTVPVREMELIAWQMIFPPPLLETPKGSYFLTLIQHEYLPLGHVDSLCLCHNSVPKKMSCFLPQATT